VVVGGLAAGFPSICGQIRRKKTDAVVGRAFQVGGIWGKKRYWLQVRHHPKKRRKIPGQWYRDRQSYMAFVQPDEYPADAKP
jgi:hypothetical protein